MKEFEELLDIMHRLRQECPWDRDQNLLSLRAYLLEEAYECLEAMNSPDENHHIEELGDLLLQIIFQAEILSEQNPNGPAILKVIQTLKDKLIRRHPHVFADKKLSQASEVAGQWDEIKKSEKKSSDQKSLLDGISKSLTSLQLAQKLGDKSRKVKFDWNTSEEVWKQFLSEIEELKQAKTSSEKEHEIGDVFFSLVQWARHQNIDAEVALATANSRFRSRFQKMEAEASKTKTPFQDLSLEDKEKLWQKAKLEDAQ